jgi:diguanylate cyclase (GGDEF)-like protein/PAS domain S-box-containing protein
VGPEPGGRSRLRRTVTITAVYATLAAGWIYASDALLGFLISDPALLTAIETLKGWLFVAVTSGFLFALLRGAPADEHAEDDSEPAEASFSIWPPLLFLFVFVAVVGGTAYLVYRQIASAARGHARDTVAAVADLKQRQLSEWITDRRHDAEAITHDAIMASDTESWLAHGAPADETGRRIRAALQTLSALHGWSHVALVDASGAVRIDVGQSRGTSDALRGAALKSIESHRLLFTDFHRDAGDATIQLGFAAPILAGGGTEPRAIACVIMQIVPERFIYPMIESWPLPSASGETLLVRRDGNSVVYLNPLRHRRVEPLTLRLPLDNENLVARNAVLGARGTMTGVDYRGMPVMAVVRNVPETPWLLIAKVDLQEVNGPVVEAARLVAMFGLVLVLAAALTTVFWLQRQRANAVLRQFRATRERTALVKHLDYLTRYANDIILLMDEDGAIVDANERALGTYGYSRLELIGANIRTLRQSSQLASFSDQWRKAGDDGGAVFETVHQRKDGTVFPVEVSSRAIDVEGSTLRQSIIRDITDRKDAEKKILRLSSLYAALSEMNKAVVHGKQRDELLAELCRVAVEHGGFQFAWVGLTTPGGVLDVVARYGHDSGYLDGLKISTDPSQPSGRGPTGTAIRERRTYVSNDFFTDPNTRLWRDSATVVGFRSSAAFPLSNGGTVIGALSVYAAETNFFDRQTIALLEEMTNDTSFAIDNLTKEEGRRSAEAAMRESEEKYRLLFSREQDGIALFDAETTRFLEANEAFMHMTGYAPSEITALHVGDVTAEPQASLQSIRKVREAGSDRVAARRVRRKDGTEIWTEIDLNSFVWRGRELVSAIVRDISEKKKAEENALLWANVLEDSAEGIVITDADQHILTVNKAFTSVTGYAPEDVIGRRPAILKSGRHDRGFYHVMWRTIRESGRWQGEIWNRRHNGEVYPEWLSITAVHNAAGELTHYVGIFTDTSERKATAERIEFLASHDFLTGLPNRSMVNDLARQALATAHRKSKIVALLFLDLDRFKTINDSLGHATGDTLLQRIATTLTKSVREQDTVARIGGDEFLVILADLGHDQDAVLVAEKIMNAVKQEIVIDGHELAVTASVGISIYPNDGEDVAALIRNADAAMYHAKERGRNNYQFFTPDMNARASEALSMAIRLRAALERNEFVLHYQPQVQTTTGRIIGAEALIRWNHRDLGFITAERFIPIAEEHGLIVPIGEWVLKAACAQLRKWLDEGLPAVPVAVNMSAVQFRQPGLAARIRRILDESGVTPNYIELEVTETILMHDAEQTISVLRELDEMGVSLAIDDFGTGYSSLNYLRRFPIRKLKIDQSFVRDITTNPDAAAIAAAIVSMGKSLKLRVIAEGVETAEQLEFLAQRQCDELQGFYIGRPADAEAFSRLLAVKVT